MGSRSGSPATIRTRQGTTPSSSLGRQGNLRQCEVRRVAGCRGCRGNASAMMVVKARSQVARVKTSSGASEILLRPGKMSQDPLERTKVRKRQCAYLYSHEQRTRYADERCNDPEGFKVSCPSIMDVFVVVMQMIHGEKRSRRINELSGRVNIKRISESVEHGDFTRSQGAGWNLPDPGPVGRQAGIATKAQCSFRNHHLLLRVRNQSA